MTSSTSISSSALAAKAMLVSLAVSQWGNRITDKKISEEVNDQHGVAHDMGRYNKMLIRRDALAGLGSVVSRARTFWAEQTLPWTDGGSRILPAANYWHYVERQRVFAGEFDHEVELLAQKYPEHVEDAKQRLNGAFDAKNYPNVAELRRKFSMNVAITPLPASADFRCDLSDAEVAKIQADVEKRIGDQFDIATRELFQRVAGAVTHLRDKLSAYEVDAETGKVKSPFRDSAIGNLREIVDLLPRLNVTGNADLEDVARRLSETLCLREPSDLRADEKLRDVSVRTADDILAMMSDYVGGEG